MRTNWVRYEIDLDNPPAISPEDQASLKTLAERPDSEIDFSDIPPLTEEFFKQAVPFRTLLERHRSARIQVEPEIFAWLKTQTNDPQSHINEMLRLQKEKALTPSS